MKYSWQTSIGIGTIVAIAAGWFILHEGKEGPRQAEAASLMLPDLSPQQQTGRGGTLGPLRDTILMNRGETVEIAFVADNPGEWLLHCHMLEHSASGMMTWLRVT